MIFLYITYAVVLTGGVFYLFARQLIRYHLEQKFQVHKHMIGDNSAKS